MIPDSFVDGVPTLTRDREHERARAAYRAQRRLPTRHGLVIREMKCATLLPAPGPMATSDDDGISDDERRKVRNKLKAMRRAGR